MAQGDSIKILVVGEGAVGKSTLVARWLEKQFNPSFTVTIGVASSQKVLLRGKKSLKVFIWDAAGKQEFRTITPVYYKKAQGILIVYDITDRKSFEQVKYWWGQVQEHGEPGTPLYVLGNKTDLVDENMISLRIPKSEEDKLASELKVPLFSASAKTGEGVEETFTALLADICEDRRSSLGELLSQKSVKVRTGFAGLLRKIQAAVKFKREIDTKATNTSLEVRDAQAGPMVFTPQVSADESGKEGEKPVAEPPMLVAPSCAVMENDATHASHTKMTLNSKNTGAPIGVCEVELDDTALIVEVPDEDLALATGRELAPPSNCLQQQMCWFCSDCRSPPS